MSAEIKKLDVLAILEADYIDASKERQWYSDAKQLAIDSQNAREAVAELFDAIQKDAAGYAMAAGMGISEWPSFVPHRTYAVLSRIGEIE